MIVVLILVVVVAAISFYDYFNTRSWQQVTSNVRNNVVFEKRNRSYGAYTIRRDYDKRIMIIIIGLIGGTGILFATTRNNGANKKITIPKTVIYEYDLVIKKDDKKEIYKTPETEKTETKVETQKFTEPDITDEKTPEPTPIVDPTKAVGAVEVIGKDPFGGKDPEIPEGTGEPVTGTPEPPKKGPEMYVDEQAEFPGGNEKLKPYLEDHLKYPQIAVELGLQGKCHTQFVVNTIGDISDVTVTRGVPDCKECDKEAVKVIKAMPRWKPAKKNGKTVACYYNLPISFRLSGN